MNGELNAPMSALLILAGVALVALALLDLSVKCYRGEIDPGQRSGHVLASRRETGNKRR